ITPSNEDIKTTARLRDCGQLLGIDLLDHVIIGDHEYLSMVEAGYFD
ncbi:JAB domain-containing protein, partial [Staphylococcus cohnii]